MHVSLAECELASEEVIYLCMCIRDSKNIQGIHLSGNKFSYYDRRLMRALFPAKVNWPMAPATVAKFDKISARDKVTLVNLNTCFMMQLPPAYVPEVGMSAVHSAEEVKRKINSYKIWKEINEKKEKAEKGSDEVARAKVGENSKNLVNERLAEVQEQSRQKASSSLPPTKTLARRGAGRLETEASASARSEKNQFTRSASWYKRWTEARVDKYMRQEEEDRTYDPFTMLDFYGRKKQSIDMQKRGEIKHVKKNDKQWV